MKPRPLTQSSSRHRPRGRTRRSPGGRTANACGLRRKAHADPTRAGSPGIAAEHRNAERRLELPQRCAPRSPPLRGRCRGLLPGQAEDGTQGDDRRAVRGVGLGRREGGLDHPELLAELAALELRLHGCLEQAIAEVLVAAEEVAGTPAPGRRAVRQHSGVSAMSCCSESAC